MKKVFLLALVAIMAVAFVGCAGTPEESVADTTWYLVEGVDSEGNVVTGEQVEALFGETYFMFNADGSTEVAGSGQVDTSSTWEQDGNTITLTNPAGTSVMMLENGQLIVEAPVRMVFEQ